MDWYFDLPLSERWWVALAITLGVGLILGIFMSRESRRRQPIHGGLGALFFHYLGSSAVSAVIPGVIIGLLSGLNFFRLMALGLSCLAICLTNLLIYGAFESQAPVVELKPKRELD